jgi:hypothetical protein
MMGLFGANKVCPSSYIIEEDPFKKERKKSQERYLFFGTRLQSGR